MDKDQLKDEMLKRAGALEALIAQEGWQLIQAYYEAKLKAFVNSTLVSNKTVQECETDRLKLMGLKELLGYIDGHLQQLAKFREDEQKAKRPTGKRE